MKANTYPLGTQLKLVRGTTLWGQEYVSGKASVIYEVAEFVHDGSSMERISLRAIGSNSLAFVGITPDLFEKVGYPQGPAS
jgi:hypothetical protein